MNYFETQIAQSLQANTSERNEIKHHTSGAYRSYFKVTELALASSAAALQELGALLGAETLEMDRRLALLWFHFTTRPVGWEAPSAWDAIAGDYQCADGWIRLHTNAPHHQKAALEVLGCAPDRDAVAKLLQTKAKDVIEAEVVANQGCAAAMRSLAEWQDHPQGTAVAQEPLIAWSHVREASPTSRGLRGVKVLDLTRVLAGPVATRFLAGFGADVLRIDPPHWNEPAVELEVTLGKSCAGLDLTKAEDRAVFDSLLGQADILVHGYRPGALAAMGYGRDRLSDLNPNLVDVSLCAYGWSGPWAGRRGFDSLVQMSCGIASEGMTRSGAARPVPLPVQALDFATGYLVAAAALRALRLRQLEGKVTSAQLSLARTAHLLISAGTQDASGENLAPLDRDYAVAREQTTWGEVQRIKPPFLVDGVAPQWAVAAGALRRHAPKWLQG